MFDLQVYVKISPKMVNPRDTAGERRRRRRRSAICFSVWQHVEISEQIRPW